MDISMWLKIWKKKKKMWDEVKVNAVLDAYIVISCHDLEKAISKLENEIVFGPITDQLGRWKF